MTAPAIPARIGCYVALRLLGHAVLLLVVLALVLVAVAPRLGDAGFWPSAWSLAGPALVAAALMTSWRLQRTGERAAVDVAAPGPVLAVPLLVAAVLWHAPFLVLGDGVLGREPDAVGVARTWSGRGGELLLHGREFRFVFFADDRLHAEPIATAEPLAGFEPVPRNPRRLRRQLFLARGPLRTRDDPLDPTGLRWLYVLLGLIAPPLVLTSRSWPRGLPWLLPFPAIVALL